MKFFPTRINVLNSINMGPGHLTPMGVFKVVFNKEGMGIRLLGEVILRVDSLLVQVVGESILRICLVRLLVDGGEQV
jgi:hypothetical protein